MGEFNRALGIPHQVEALGQVWLVPELGPGVRGEYESWLEGNALFTARPARQEYERLEEMAAAAPRDPFLRRRAAAAKQEWRDTLEEARNAVTAQVYRWYGEVCLASLRTVGGAAYLLYLLLRQHHTDITPERCIDLWEV